MSDKPTPMDKSEAKAIVAGVAEKSKTPERVAATNYPVITFIARYWMLLIFAVLCIMATTSESVFKVVGPLIYVPAAGAVVMVLNLLYTHLFYRQTLDLEVHNGAYLVNWDSLTPWQKIIIHTVVRVGFFIGLCIVAAAVAK